MKKLLLFAFIAIVAIGCRKKKDDSTTTTGGSTYEQRLAGDWSLTSLDYDFELPSLIPGGPATPINGSATNVKGDFMITNNPNRLVYDFSFDVSAGGLGSIPINEQQSADWTLSSDEKTIYLEHDDGTSNRLEVLDNQANTQVFKMTVTRNVPLMGDLDIETVITLSRKN